MKRRRIGNEKKDEVLGDIGTSEELAVALRKLARLEERIVEIVDCLADHDAEVDDLLDETFCSYDRRRLRRLGSPRLH